jgi:hypothetical protein
VQLESVRPNNALNLTKRDILLVGALRAPSSLKRPSQVSAVFDRLTQRDEAVRGRLTRSLLAVAGLVTTLSGAACLGFTCEDEVLIQSSSPKGPSSVRVVLRGCDATTPFFTIAQARGGGFFDRWTEVARIVGRPVMEIRWTSVKTAIVAYGMCSPGDPVRGGEGVRGLEVLVVNDPLLSSQCFPGGYWEPHPQESTGGRTTK